MRVYGNAILVLSLMLLLSMGAATPAFAATSATLTEWTIPTSNSGPVGLALDPSGNCCWFVEFFANKVAHFDPTTGTFQEWPIPTGGSQTTGLATTNLNGQLEVWGAEFGANKVFAFFPATGSYREYSLPNAGSGPEYISIEPSGANVRVWFTEITRNAWGEIRVDTPGTGAATLFEDTLPPGAGGGANGVYAGVGVIWFAGAQGLVKFDRGANQYTSWPLPAHGSANGRFIAFDNLGEPWYTQGENSASSTDSWVGVLRGDNTIKNWQVPTTGADLRLVSVNPVTQHPWIAEYMAAANGGKIAELDPSAGGSVVGSAPTVSSYGGTSGAKTPANSGPFGVTTSVVAAATSSNTGTTTGQFTEWTLAPNSEPHDVIVDASGTTWILETSANKVAKLVISQPDFSLAPSPATISIPQGGSGSVTITGTSILSYVGGVTLSITGSVPSGVTFSAFSPNPINVPSGGTAVATFTINVAGSAATGTSTITVSGTGGATHTTTFDLTITSGADFSLALSSSALTVGSGSSGTDTVTVTSIAGFNAPVNLATSGSLPAGVHVGFSPDPVTPPSGGSVTSTATITVDGGTAAQTTAVTIVGSSDSLSHSETLTLTITLTPDFSIGTSPNSLSINPGESGTSDISVGSTNGFSSPVTLTYSWFGTAPSGVSINLPGPVTPPSGGTATSTLTVTLASDASSGTFTLAVTGTSGALTHSANVGLTIGTATSTTTATTTPAGPACLIATATYGSELSPEVQLLRNFRDNSILKTSAGSGFMIAFNSWYYSFSPAVANYIDTHGVERGAMKALLYPAIGIMFVSSGVFTAMSGFPELAAVLSGLLASSLLGAVYVGLPLGLIMAKVRKMRGWKKQRVFEKILGVTLAVGLGGVLLGELVPYGPIMIAATTTTVLTTLFLVAVVTSAAISKRLTNVHLRFH
jgi:streptogramin lyase